MDVVRRWVPSAGLKDGLISDDPMRELPTLMAVDIEAPFVFFSQLFLQPRRGYEPPDTLDLVKPFGQREFLEILFSKFGADRNAIVEAYAQADRLGEVVRTSNVNGTSSEAYARCVIC
jgi:hypothetical protein